MSSQIAKYKSYASDSIVTFTSYWGGKDKEKCIQITIGGNYVNLEKVDIIDLQTVLEDWLDK